MAEVLQEPTTDQSALIGSISWVGSIKHYSTQNETRLDVQHLEVLDYFQVNRIYF